MSPAGRPPSWRWAEGTAPPSPSAAARTLRRAAHRRGLGGRRRWVERAPERVARRGGAGRHAQVPGRPGRRGLGPGRGLRAPLRGGGAGRARPGQPDPGRADRGHRRPGVRRAGGGRAAGGRRRRAAGHRRAGGAQGRVGHGQVAGQVAVSAAGNIETVSLVPADAPAAARWPSSGSRRRTRSSSAPGRSSPACWPRPLSQGIAEAVARCRGQRVYVCNLRPQQPETAGFDVAAHLDALARHGVPVDVVLCDTSLGMPLGSGSHRPGDVPLTADESSGPQSWQTGAGTLQSAGIAPERKLVPDGGAGRYQWVRPDRTELPPCRPGHRAPMWRWWASTT